MELGPPGRRKEPLNVFWMALALVLAAAVGAGLGIVWHAVGSGDEEPVPAEAPAN